MIWKFHKQTLHLPSVPLHWLMCLASVPVVAAQHQQGVTCSIQSLPVFPQPRSQWGIYASTFAFRLSHPAAQRGVPDQSVDVGSRQTAQAQGIDISKLKRPYQHRLKPSKTEQTVTQFSASAYH